MTQTTKPRNSFGTYGGCETHNRVDCERCPRVVAECWTCVTCDVSVDVPAGTAHGYYDAAREQHRAAGHDVREVK